MKNCFVFTYLILFSICSNRIAAQSLSLADIISLKNKDYGWINEYLSEKQFQFDAKHELVSDNYKYYTWTRYDNTNGFYWKSVSAFFDINGDFEKTPNEIQYLINDSKTHASLKKQMTQLGFKFIGSYEEKEDKDKVNIQSVYYNGKICILITTYTNGQKKFVIFFSKSFYEDYIQTNLVR